jgi:hypothetical protein
MVIFGGGGNRLCSIRQAAAGNVALKNNIIGATFPILKR